MRACAICEFFCKAAGEQTASTTLHKLTSGEDLNTGFYNSSYSPPLVVVDSTPLQIAMDKNKECK